MEPDSRNVRYLRFVGGRNKGQSDEEIAGALGFDSARQLWGRLAEYGFPVCPDCGEQFPARRHKCKKPTHKGGRGRGVKGEVVELPDATGAMPMFEAALDKLRRDMAWLPVRREHRKGRRFVAEHRLSGERGESVRVYSRDSVGSERWKTWCRERGLDPAADAHQIPHDVDSPLDIPKDYPAWPLPELIGTYVLAGLEVDDLMAVLQQEPDRVDRAELDNVVGWLRRYAGHVAALVRGAPPGQTKAWRRGAEITDAERRLATHIRERLQGMRGDQEIALRIVADELRNGGFWPLPPGFEPTVEEVRRLADLD